MHHPTDRITHTTAFATPVMEHWLEQEIAQWVHPMKDRSDDPSHHERTLYLRATSCSLFYLTTHSTVYLWLFCIRHMVRDHSDRQETILSISFLCCHFMGYSFQLTARDLLYAPFHRQDSTYLGLCYTSCAALAGMRNSSMGRPRGINHTT